MAGAETSWGPPCGGAAADDMLQFGDTARASNREGTKAGAKKTKIITLQTPPTNLAALAASRDQIGNGIFEPARALCLQVGCFKVGTH